MAIVLLPFDAGPFALRMGVHALDPADWLDVDDDLTADLALKAELLATRRDELVLLVDAGVIDAGEVAAAAGELDDVVAAWWRDRGSGPPEPDPGLHPVVRASLRTQEDWCLLMGPPGDPPVLAAGCVCFPTRWVPTEKVGLPLGAIHGPVASYAERLASPVDRFVARLRVDAPVWRANWNLVDDPARCQAYVPEPGRRIECAPGAVADVVHLRVERQTLRRLPRTGAVAFGIRIHQRPLRAFEARPGVAADLLGAVRALPPATFAYKGLAAFWAELEPWLERVASG